VFQYGRENIEIAKKDRYASCDNSENEDKDDEEGQGDTKQKSSHSITSPPTNHGDHLLQKTDKKLKNGVLANSSTSVISREHLILGPDPEQNYSSANSNVTSAEDHTTVTHVSKPYGIRYEKLIHSHIYEGCSERYVCCIFSFDNMSSYDL
jgi:hypothetical protein